jgi:hypothetical protein
MKLQSMIARVTVAVVFILTSATLAHAQATRTWVSGVGDDVNPCSRTAPCKTFAGAISKTATNGYINVLDPGGFGALTITKSITIDGGPFMAGVLAAGTNGFVINNATAKVTIRNVDIEGLCGPAACQGGQAGGLNGIQVINVGELHVENVHITSFQQNGINFNPGGGGGLLFVENTTIKQTAVGIQANNARAIVNRVRLEANGSGLTAGVGGSVTVRDSVATGGSQGFVANTASSILNIENCVTSQNAFGISAGSTSTVRVSNSGIFSNSSVGLNNGGSANLISLGGNSIQGNVSAGAFTNTQAKQ